MKDILRVCTLLVFLFIVVVESSPKIGVIFQNGVSSSCAQKYYSIDTSTCSCKEIGCPASSMGSDPQVNEFGSNAVSDMTSGGSYIFIDEYWSYIQQVYPNGTQANSPKSMVQQQCISNSATKSIYKVTSIQYDLKNKVLYGLAMVPNEITQKYESKIVQLDVSTGECKDVLTGIAGTGVQWPYTCCGYNNGPAFDVATSTYYAFGPSKYTQSPTSNTVAAIDIPNKSYTIGFLSSHITVGHGFMFHDTTLGLFALGYENREYGIYKLNTWSSYGAIADELVVSLGKPTPSSAVYDQSTQTLYLLIENLSILASVDMKAMKLTTCTMPTTCSGINWQWSIMLNS